MSLRAHWAAVAVVVACGGRVITSADGGTGSGGNTSSTDEGGSSFGICPGNPPVPGSACTDSTQGCAYCVNGPSWCEVRVICQSGAWQYLGDAGPSTCG